MRSGVSTILSCCENGIRVDQVRRAELRVADRGLGGAAEKPLAVAPEPGASTEKEAAAAGGD